ncbi:MAG: 8-amino-7-oxononanoate synthase, partial [Chitinophagaceae bacterium]|nr:8-amino-7-oxononanoate synthase [Chitinophagaceae bacterium]
IKVDHDLPSGSTGSRLISGNYPLIEKVEKDIAEFHDAEAALIFNSGYDANTGILSCVPQKGDTILYDALSHASIRDGIRLSFARSFSFAHNDVDDLEKKLQAAEGNIFIITESVFSMDGDTAPLAEIIKLCKEYNAKLIIDEAHGIGVIGEKGEGLMQSLGLHKACFARIYTYGKAAGCHGAAIAGSQALKDYLINFCRQFIYTTALPASAVQTISAAYSMFPGMKNERQHLQKLVKTFHENVGSLTISTSFTPIQGIIIPGNEQVKKASSFLRESSFDVRPILYPTVPLSKERLRVVLHAFNTEDEVISMLGKLRIPCIYSA